MNWGIYSKLRPGDDEIRVPPIDGPFGLSISCLAAGSKWSSMAVFK
jgi:hypothetical protein